MSVKIQTEWECPFCIIQNHITITKPLVFQGVTGWERCESCDSEFLLRWSKVQKGQVSYTSINVKPTQKGLDLKKELDKLKQPTKENAK